MAMEIENKPGRGVMFKNRDARENSPTWKGEAALETPAGLITVDMAAWERVSKKGTPYLSFSVKVKATSPKEPF